MQPCGPRAAQGNLLSAHTRTALTLQHSTTRFPCWSRTRRKKASRYIRIKPLPSQTPRPQLRQQPATSDTPYARSTQDPLTAQLALPPSQSGVALNGPIEGMCIPPPVPGLLARRHKG